MKIVKFVIVILIFLMPGAAWSQDTEVTATVDNNEVGIQDQLQFTITVSGNGSDDAEAPRFSNGKGFRIVSGPSIGTQFQWINGKTSSNKSFTYTLLPEKEGQFTIDPVEVRVGNRVYKTRPVEIRVTSGSRGPSPSRQRFPNFFNPFEDDDSPSPRLDADAVMVKAELDRRTAYPGQQVTLTYTLYTRVSVVGYQLQDSPPLSGFWVEDLEIDKNQKGERRVIGGREYQAYVIKKQALFATSAGKLKIPSSTLAISAAAGRDIFSFTRGEQTLYRKTPEIFLEVKPLPAAGKPADFSNAVGEFSLSAALDKKEAASGDAVALRVKLEGRGNLKMVPDISVPPMPDFSIYSSKRVDANRLYPEDQLGGEKAWEYVLVPKAPGRQTIPSLSFSFFNPDGEKYETVTTPALSLEVTGGAESSTGFSGLSDSARQDLIRRGSDISFIKQSPGTLKENAKPLYHDWRFYLPAVLSLVMNAGAFFYRRQRSRNGDNAAARSRKARRSALRQLRAAEKEGRTDARRYYDRAAAALSGYLSDRFDLAEIELTGDNLERTLSAYSAPPEIMRETRACLQECDFGRFVSAADTAEKRAALSTRIHKIIDALGAISTENDANA